MDCCRAAGVAGGGYAGKSLVQGARYSIAVKRAIIEIPVSTGKDASGGVLGGFELAGRAADAAPDLVAFLATASGGAAAITIVYRLYGER